MGLISKMTVNGPLSDISLFGDVIKRGSKETFPGKNLVRRPDQPIKGVHLSSLTPG